MAAAEDNVFVLDGVKYMPAGVHVIFSGIDGKGDAKQSKQASSIDTTRAAAVTVKEIVQQAARKVFFNEITRPERLP